MGNSLCAALPGIHVFTGSDYTTSFNLLTKVRPLELLGTSEDAKKVSPFIKEFHSEREVQTTFKTVKFTCVMYSRKKFASVYEARLKLFLKGTVKQK